MDENSGAYIVSWDFSNGKDNSVLLVGRQVPMKPIGHRIEIVNAFQGADAEALWQMLTERKDVIRDVY
jgi:hypothetical protein